MYPLKMVPAYKNYIWGGQKLPLEYGKKTDLRPLAESWEFSVHPDGDSLIENGKFTGLSLSKVLADNPSFIGDNEGFPVLIKFIDALDNLSLQVHPDNDYSRKVENQNGKNELWYVVDALPGAELIVGLNKNLSKSEIRSQIEDGTFLDSVNRISVKKGDCFEIPAGLLHAIGKGVLIYEIQQNSNVTYRVYDYMRKDPNGNLRELHIDKAVDVINSNLKSRNFGDAKEAKEDGCSYTVLSEWQWFKVYKLNITTCAKLNADESSYNTITSLNSTLIIEHENKSYEMKKGDSYFIPAGLGKYTIKGEGIVIKTTL